MSIGKFVFIVVLWLAISDSSCGGAEKKEEVSDGDLPSSNLCQNCSICQYPCHPLPPPAPSGYPSYGAPPPPAQWTPVQGNCPPTPMGQCCQQHPPPTPYGYGYMPYDENISTCLRFQFLDSILFPSVISVLLIFVLHA